ncbi:hypothetical protein LMG28688_06860 [Paraburkholderia caffeinitolerans]|uniref:Uncharacterized protein n=1 Tax=Paraburkholderia caffeinitolerans TaxID=1723730 RepID=A0A6J5GXH5_9BURK|nr:hypothetical protein [Paraburkholderia caffeinitolerans]CAB3808842.1 hypothetical protein LMG28688_06860 [Paraburkholderia caffeinitolerans]
MFGLYPAGPDWVQHFNATSSARDVQQLLVKHAGFTAGLFHQPYGPARGAVIAVRHGFVVMVHEDNASEVELVVAPDVEMTNLLWSHSNGYASQWSPRELKALTACDSWEQLLKLAGTRFRAACTALERAIDGSIVPVATAPVDPVIAAPFPDDDDVPWLPSDYLHDAPVGEGIPCDR